MFHKMMTPYAEAALEILMDGGYMRSEKQSDGSILIRLFNNKNEKLNGHYNSVQIVLDGMGYLNGTILPEGDHHIVEWTYWDQCDPWDYDPRKDRDNLYA